MSKVSERYLVFSCNFFSFVGCVQRSHHERTHYYIQSDSFKNIYKQIGGLYDKGMTTCGYITVSGTSGTTDTKVCSERIFIS